jgi:hypothetical protein
VFFNFSIRDNTRPVVTGAVWSDMAAARNVILKWREKLVPVYAARWREIVQDGGCVKEHGPLSKMAAARNVIILKKGGK